MSGFLLDHRPRGLSVTRRLLSWVAAPFVYQRAKRKGATTGRLDINPFNSILA